MPLFNEDLVSLFETIFKTPEENCISYFGEQPVDFDIFFWSDERYSKFSNFAKSPIVLDERSWPTVEHYFQAMKTLDFEAQERIRKASNPKKAKYLGRQVKLRKDWELVKEEFMLNALRQKFSSEPFKSLLLDTKNSRIYEDSPYDSEWGTGARKKIGTGRNLLGKLLMKVRDELRGIFDTETRSLF